MLKAYCETKVRFESASVPLTPPRIVSTPTPIGSSAAIALRKMNSSRSRASGSETSSARCRSASNVVLNAWLIGTLPVTTTASGSEWTSAVSWRR